jgi:rhodanese-related sulfurtransferase
LRLQALATPGHTPEHLAYVLSDGSRPVALFSGGSLLVGAVARTDLIAPDRTEPLARALWRSLHERILGLPDEVAVYPTHGAGSFCSAPTGGERVTTIGLERRRNRLLTAPDEDTFVRWLIAGLGSYPPYFLRLREVNRQGPRLLGPRGPLPDLTVDEVRRRLAAGAQLVDARPVDRWASGHVPAALAVTLRPQFATWLGWHLPLDTELVFVVDDDQDEIDLVRQAHSVGFDRLAGRLAGGMTTWSAADQPVARTPLVAAAELDGHRVVDVRQASEWDSGHIPAAVHVELGALGADPTLAPAGPVVLACGHGERAATAASLLERAGRRDTAVLRGGPGDWAAVTGRCLDTA